MPDNQEENKSPRPRRYYNYSRLIPGSILLLLGLLFLLNNYGIIQGDVMGKLWPLFLILPGLIILFAPGKEDQRKD